MRVASLLGLVVSLFLCAIAVSSTSEVVQQRRSEQDRALQSAVSTETAVISSARRQTRGSLALMLVNPDVDALLDGRALTTAQRSSDLADVSRALATVQSNALVSVVAACLDDAKGRQVTCGTPRSVLFPAQLNEQFLALAASSPSGAASGVFASPVDSQLTAAYVAPVRAHGRLLGVVHLDISIGAVTSSRAVLADVPGVSLQLASAIPGRLFFFRPLPFPVPRGAAAAIPSIPLGGKLDSRPTSLLAAGHRAMAASLPVGVGGGRRTAAVVALARAAEPTLANAWSTWALTLAAIGLVLLVASAVGLLVSHRRVTRELSTDSLTGLRNRRALMEDLPRVFQGASEERPAYLWFFDLNGFKSYNDHFGHPAGDTLLRRLAERLQDTVGERGRTYRLGGDEFCALVTGPVEDPHSLFVDAREALSEHGGAFTVTAAAGAVELPRESTEPSKALKLADRRMYQHKATSRGGAADLLTSVLHAALAQRHPELGEHSSDVAGDVEQLARAIGLDGASVDAIIKAGDLHDVGKLGIPDEIIFKPGALTDEEWAFMKQHTVMGEKIIAAAGPSLQQIAPLVRASHERWDGLGYPDGLAGEEIPLGARIIAICDSFHAMLDERCYKQAMSVEDALAELRRCAGTQFDPQLVETFCRLVDNRMASVQP
jgi:diguanylate cyclase (GGDEF)-like protein